MTAKSAAVIWLERLRETGVAKGAVYDALVGAATADPRDPWSPGIPGARGARRALDVDVLTGR